MGRPKGSLNKATASIKAIAQPYCPEAVDTLVNIMRDPEKPPQARVAAANAILDRGYGKAPQSVDMDMKGDLTIAQVVHEHVKE